MAALEGKLETWLDPPLPSLYTRLGRKTMLKEDELAARFEHSVDSSQCFEYVRYRAHGERTDYGVHTGVAKRDLFTR